MTARAVLLCGHGSRDPGAIAEFEATAAGLRRRLAAHDFAVGYLEFCRPTIADALAALAARGAARICAVPAMLLAARHVRTDLPAVISRFAVANPGVGVRLARALTDDAELRAAAAERVAAAAPGRRERSLLVVVGRGASDPAANRHIAETARDLGERLGFGGAEAAFAGIAEPRVAAALQRAAGLGFDRIIVFPYLLFAGVLAARIAAETAIAAAKCPGVAFVKAGHLGDHPLVLDALAERVGECFDCGHEPG